MCACRTFPAAPSRSFSRTSKARRRRWTRSATGTPDALAELGELERAGVLWGAIEAQYAGAPLGGWARHRASCEAKIEEIAHRPEFEHARTEGRELDLDQAVEQALGFSS
jgi:hypothetical protein